MAMTVMIELVTMMMKMMGVISQNNDNCEDDDKDNDEVNIQK